MVRLFQSDYFWLILSGVLLLAGIGLTIGFWGWLHPPKPTTVSNSVTLRNAGILIGGVLAFVFAVWRGLVAKRQADAAQRQAETAEQTLLHERYQRGVEMLGSDILPVRMGGTYTLRRLAEDHPDPYHEQVAQLLGDFVRNPTVAEEYQNGPNSNEELP